MAGKRLILMYWAGGLERAGGIGRMAGNLLAARSDAGRPETVRCLDTRGTRSIVLAPFHLLAALARTVLARLSGRSTIAHVHMADAGSTVRKVIVCRLLTALGIPYLLHLHPGNYDVYFRALPGWGKRLVRGAFGRAAAVAVLGERWRRLVVEEIGVGPARVRVIPNGVADPGGSVARPPAGVPLILLLGEMQPWKGIGELIAALAALVDRPWELVCAGRGDPSPYAAAAAAAGIAGRVRFVGWLAREESAAMLRAASIVAVPSHIEGFSVALIEALAHGIPVVATPVGGHPDLLRHGENALLVPPGDVPALTGALAALLDDPALRARIGRAGRATFSANLDIRVIESRFAELYGEIRDAPRPDRLPRAGLAAATGHEGIR